MAEEKGKYPLDVKLGPDKYRRYYFDSEKERENWDRMHRKSKLYIPYFLLGVAINFTMYFSGLNLAHDILMGALVGIGIPVFCMYTLSEVHFLIMRRLRNQNRQNAA